MWECEELRAVCKRDAAFFTDCGIWTCAGDRVPSCWPFCGAMATLFGGWSLHVTLQVPLATFVPHAHSSTVEVQRSTASAALDQRTQGFGLLCR